MLFSPQTPILFHDPVSYAISSRSTSLSGIESNDSFPGEATPRYMDGPDFWEDIDLSDPFVPTAEEAAAAELESAAAEVLVEEAALTVAEEVAATTLAVESAVLAPILVPIAIAGAIGYGIWSYFSSDDKTNAAPYVAPHFDPGLQVESSPDDFFSADVSTIPSLRVFTPGASTTYDPGRATQPSAGKVVYDPYLSPPNPNKISLSSWLRQKPLRKTKNRLSL